MSTGLKVALVVKSENDKKELVNGLIKSILNDKLSSHRNNVIEIIKPCNEVVYTTDYVDYSINLREAKLSFMEAMRDINQQGSKVYYKLMVITEPYDVEVDTNDENGDVLYEYYVEQKFNIGV